MAVEELNAKLFRLLKDELESLRIGHSFNKERLHLMKEICHLLAYYQYVDMDNSDIVKIIRFYD